MEEYDTHVRALADRLLADYSRLYEQLLKLAIDDVFLAPPTITDRIQRHRQINLTRLFGTLDYDPAHDSKAERRARKA